MTQISPRQARDAQDHFTRMNRAKDRAALRAAAVEISCAIGLVLLAATAGYFAHPSTCPTPPGWTIDPD